MLMLCWFYKDGNAFILKIKVWVLLCMLRHICDKCTSITMWAEAAFAPNLVKTTDLVWRGSNSWIFCHLACCDYGATSPNKGSSKNKNLTVSNESFSGAKQMSRQRKQQDAFHSSADWDNHIFIFLRDIGLAAFLLCFSLHSRPWHKDDMVW